MWIMPLVLYLNSPHKTQGHLDFLQLLEVLRFCILQLVTWGRIFVKGVKSVSRFAFYLDSHLVVPAIIICLKDYLFSISLPLLIFKNQLTVFIWVCFWALHFIPWYVSLSLSFYFFWPRLLLLFSLYVVSDSLHPQGR